MANHEKHIDDLLRDALGDHTEQPPSGAWADMEAKLDEGKTLIDVFFAAALSDHTETPPANAWAHMEAKLDGKTEFDHAFEEALGDYAEMPPAGAWADMETRLEKKPGRRRGVIWLWSAAAVAGLLVLSYFVRENYEQYSANRKAEIRTEVPVTTPVINTPASQPEVITGPPVTTLQNEPEQISRTPKDNAPVAHKSAPKQETPEVVQQEETPVQKAEPKAEQMPAEPQEVVAQNDPSDKIKQVNADDIASAIRRRTKGTVMNLKRSRYADSVAEVIAQQKADEEKAKQQEVPVVSDPIPVIAANADSVKDIVNEVSVAQPDTMSALVMDAINTTLKSMEVTQDAIPSSGVSVPVENGLEEIGALASKAAETITADPDKGTLAPFIGPMEDTDANTATLIASAGSTIPDADMIMRRPITFDWLVKTGYEGGLNKRTANKFVLATAMQINFSEKVSLILQPAIKSGKANYSQVSARESYYAITHSSQDSNRVPKIYNSAQGVQTDSLRTGYYYQQKHDSLVVSNRLASRSIIEAELPVLLNYNLGRNFSLYAGPVVTYSSMLQMEEVVENYGNYTRTDSVIYTQKLKSGTNPPVAPSMEDVIRYNTKNIDDYNKTPYTNSTVNKIRLGYMLGTSYSYKRLSADLSVQQNLSRMNYITNPGVRSIYLQPYMRFMLGFKLNK